MNEWSLTNKRGKDVLDNKPPKKQVDALFT